MGGSVAVWCVNAYELQPNTCLIYECLICSINVEWKQARTQALVARTRCKHHAAMAPTLSRAGGRNRVEPSRVETEAKQAG